MGRTFPIWGVQPSLHGVRFMKSSAPWNKWGERLTEHVSMDTETTERGNTRPMGRVRGLSATNRPRTLSTKKEGEKTKKALYCNTILAVRTILKNRQESDKNHETKQKQLFALHPRHDLCNRKTVNTSHHRPCNER